MSVISVPDAAGSGGAVVEDVLTAVAVAVAAAAGAGAGADSPAVVTGAAATCCGEGISPTVRMSWLFSVIRL